MQSFVRKLTIHRYWKKNKKKVFFFPTKKNKKWSKNVIVRPLATASCWMMTGLYLQHFRNHSGFRVCSGSVTCDDRIVADMYFFFDDKKIICTILPKWNTFNTYRYYVWDRWKYLKCIALFERLHHTLVLFWTPSKPLWNYHG